MINKIYLDAPEPWQIGFQDPATAVMEGIINFHHDLFFFLVVIAIFVTRLLVRVVALYNDKVNVTPYKVAHASTLEIIWTIIPALILVLIAVPSFSLLYSIEEIVEPLLTVKIVGHQWYWSYEFVNPLEIIKNANPELDYNADIRFMFDSYMKPTDELFGGQFRLLEVDNRLYLPVQVNIRLLITSGDVLHSWAVPSLGIKVDACPGRLNQISLFLKRKGVFYGQCSEICGINHGFMPIAVEGVHLGNGAVVLNAPLLNVVYPLFMHTYYSAEFQDTCEAAFRKKFLDYWFSEPVFRKYHPEYSKK